MPYKLLPLIGIALMQALSILYCLHVFKRSVILRLCHRKLYETNQRKCGGKYECLTGLKISACITATPLATPANYAQPLVNGRSISFFAQTKFSILGLKQVWWLLERCRECKHLQKFLASV